MGEGAVVDHGEGKMNNTSCARHLIIYVAIVAASLSPNDVKAESGEGMSATEVVLIESLLLVGSYGASQAPDYFGFTWLALSPIFVEDGFSDAANYTSIGSMAAIGIYNISVSQEGDYSESEVMRNNFVAMNAAILLTYAVDKLTADKSNGNAKRMFSLASTGNDLLFNMKIRF